MSEHEIKLKRRPGHLLPEEVVKLQDEVFALRQAIGLATTCVPDMEMDVTNPIGMMHRVVHEMDDLRLQMAENNAVGKRLLEAAQEKSNKQQAEVHALQEAYSTLESERNQLNRELQKLKAFLVAQKALTRAVKADRDKAQELAEKRLQQAQKEMERTDEARKVAKDLHWSLGRTDWESTKDDALECNPWLGED